MQPFFYALLGTLAAFALVALAAALRFRRWRRRFGARRGPPGRWMFRGLFARLGTRPEQEKVLLDESDALADQIRALREEGRALREEIAGLVEGPALDAAALDAALRARLERLTAIRERAVGALSRFHAVLDDGQRRALAEVVRRGTARGGCGPWRHAHGGAARV